MTGRTYRLLSVALVSGLSMMTAACDPAGFVAGRVGGRIGAAVAESVPTPPAATAVSPGAYVCAYLKDVGWTRIKVGDIEGNEDALSTIGTTRETARACPK